ncbi:S41 family peptidase [Vibrio zhugei]|uniref:Tricorn protease homolog n=1 Tax=Vibrio zhugei TaxID=2479546 RepID=A0ABV7C8M3_9VIBR|nr:S41 family peptidase [Vibrio zhugei]
MKRNLLYCALLSSLSGFSQASVNQEHQGYYYSPALHGNQLVFSSEGDLWRMKLNEKNAERLTSRVGHEVGTIISPDGQQIAFVANYTKGASEAYIMPINGGVPKQVTFENSSVSLMQWTQNNHLIYSTRNTSGPGGSYHLKTLNLDTGISQDIPLYGANSASLDEKNGELYFKRFGLSTSGDNVHAYHGGGQGRIWKYKMGSHHEASLLTHADSGSSSHPMYYHDKIYYVSDKSGNKNLWSMDTDGRHPKQLTFYKQWPVYSPTLSDGKIAFQLGADIVIYTINDTASSSPKTRTLPIHLISDKPYVQERWIKNPTDYISSARLSHEGEKAVITARGKVVIAASDGTRLVKITTPPHSRIKNAILSKNKQWVYALCDASGEEQIWRFSADGSDTMKQITHQGHSIRWSLDESPDGKYLLTDDVKGQLWLVNVKTGKMKVLLKHGPNRQSFGEYTWSNDSRYVAIATQLDTDRHATVILYDVTTDKHQRLMSPRYDSYSPSFSQDGHWLYFLSDRALKVTSNSPWDPRSPSPSMENQSEIFALALEPNSLFPFEPIDELQLAKKGQEKPKKSNKTHSDNETATKPQAAPATHIVWNGLKDRLWQVPVAAGQYSKVISIKNGLILEEWNNEGERRLISLKYTHKKAKIKPLVADIQGFDISDDHRHLLIQSGEEYFITPAKLSLPKDMSEFKVDTKHWVMQINPRDEWRQMLHNAWLMHRDMFYDPTMKGVDWEQVKTTMTPYISRVSDRYELGILLAQMVGGLNTMHSQLIFGSDLPALEPKDTATPSCLGATLKHTQDGIELGHIYRSDPEVPDFASPLNKPGVDAKDGDTVVAINHDAIHSLKDVNQALNNQAGQKVLLTLRRGEKEHSTIVTPTSTSQCRQLNTQDWAEQNRRKVAKLSDNKIGYVYLQAMGTEDYEVFAREFYADLDKEGLIIDVRNNYGGNIDPWILNALLRKAWMYWKPRHGSPESGMQQAFRGHVTVLANQLTYSDGETFTAGFKALNLGPVIGRRTFGAGVWLDDANRLTDGGSIRVADIPTYSVATGKQLVEQKGVSPTIKVSNLPYATFMGQDAQLEKAIHYLQNKAKTDPILPLDHHHRS